MSRPYILISRGVHSDFYTRPQRKQIGSATFNLWPVGLSSPVFWSTEYRTTSSPSCAATRAHLPPGSNNMLQEEGEPSGAWPIAFNLPFDRSIRNPDSVPVLRLVTYTKRPLGCIAMSAGMLPAVKPSGRVLRFCRNLSSPLLSSRLQAEIEEFRSPEVYRYR